MAWVDSDIGELSAEDLIADAYRRSDAHQSMRQAWIQAASMYHGRVIGEVEPGILDTAKRVADCPDTWNVGRGIVDALVSRVSEAPPVGSLSTVGGADRYQRIAKAAKRKLKSELDLAGYVAAVTSAVQSAAIYGTSGIVMRSDANGLSLAAHSPDRLRCDEYAQATPTECMLVDVYPVADVVAMAEQAGVPLLRDQIATVSVGARTDGLVVVYEAWAPGRHAIAIAGHVIVDEEFDAPPPVAWLRFTAPTLGWYSDGILDVVMPPQVAANRTIERIGRQQDLLGRAWIEREPGSSITEEQIARLRAVGDIVPPGMRVRVPQSVSPDQIEHVRMHVSQCYQLSGQSEMASGSMRPAGLDSGRALQVYHAMQTARFAQFERALADMCMSIHRMSIEVLARSGSSRSAWDGGVELDVSWSDIGSALNDMTLTMDAESPLPQSPAARMDMALQLIGGGMDRSSALNLLGLPDPEKTVDLVGSLRDDLESVFERMVHSGEYERPRVMQLMTDPAMALELCLSYWHLVHRSDPESDRLQLLERWYLDARGMIPQAPEQGATDGGRDA